MKRLRACPSTFLFALLLLGTGAGPARAAGNSEAKVLIHLLPNNYDFYCHASQEMPACPDVRTQGALYPVIYNAFLLVVNGSAVEGVGGLTCGIEYDSGPADGIGLDVFSFGLCATLMFQHGSPVWPGPGSSTLITWDTINACQRNEPGGPGTGVVARAGYFYCAAYSAAELRIGFSQHSGHEGKVEVANCAGVSDIIDDSANPHSPSPRGIARFSANAVTPGYNPCAAPVAVTNTTWSAIKGLSGN